MFGLTFLSKEEKAELTAKKRIQELEALLRKETAIRQSSLIKAEGYQKELEKLLEETK